MFQSITSSIRSAVMHCRSSPMENAVVQDEASLTLDKGAVHCSMPVLRYRFGFVF